MADSTGIHSCRDLRFKKTWQGLGWAMVATVVWLSLTPLPPTPPEFLSWDKAQHFIAYGCLMYWYGMSFARHWRWPVLMMSLGIGLEILQGFGGIRNFDPYDMVANAIGVLIGLFVATTPLGRLLAALDALLTEELNHGN